MGIFINPYVFDSGSGYDSDALAYITAAGLTDPVEIAATNTIVLGIKAASFWSKLKAVYLFLGSSAFSHKFNLIDPTTYELTFYGGITHDYNGCAWDGSTGYADTGLVPSSVLTQDNVHCSYYSRSSGTSNGYEMGSSHNTGQWQWFGFGIYASTFGCYINNGNSSVAVVEVGISDGSGLWVGSRTSYNFLEAYRNGSAIGSSSGNNIWVNPNTPVFIGAHNLGGTPYLFSPRQCAFASIGDGLTSGEVATLNTLVQAFQTALGR